MPQNKSSKGFTSWCIGDGLLRDFWYWESEFLMARNILSWVVMYLCNLTGAELSMQDGGLFHCWCWICEYFGKANSLQFELKMLKSKSCNSSRAKPFERISVERPGDPMLQLPSSTSSFHGLLSELERPLHIANTLQMKNKLAKTSSMLHLW